MSYAGSQIEQFSNPNVYFLGAPTGVPEGHVNAQGLPDAADNARVLNENIPAAAAWKTSRFTTLDAPRLIEDDTLFRLEITGPNAGLYTVEWTSDYQTWVPLSDYVLYGDSIEVTDDVGSDAHRFYRAKSGDNYLGTQVGYIKKTVPSGYSMIANQLESGHNTVGALFPAVPDGTQLYKWIEGKQTWTVNTFNFGEWDHPEITLHPGEGMIVRNGSAPFNVSFVGHVNATLHNRVPLQLAIRSSALPQSGKLSAVLNYVPLDPGHQVYLINGSTGSYSTFTWEGDGWAPFEPFVEMGEAFWCRNPRNAFIWERILWSWPD